MGIRPNLYVVIGVNDLEQNEKTGEVTDKRYKDWNPNRRPRQYGSNKWKFKDPYKFKLDTCSFDICTRTTNMKRCKTYGELLFQEGSVFGLIINPHDDLYGSLALYCLSYIWDQFQTPGHMIVPSIPLNDDYSNEAFYLKALIKKKESNPHLSITSSFNRHDQYIRLLTKQINLKKKLIKTNQNFRGFYYEFLSQGPIFIELSRRLGMKFKMRDLKVMLAWTWD